MLERVDTGYLKPLFRWLHVVWALIGCTVSILLASAKGHPPGLAFVPIVLAIWLTGHGVLWLSRRLATKGKYGRTDVVNDRWPLLLIMFVCLFGMVFIFGIFGFGWHIFSGQRWRLEMFLLLVFWICSSLCFFGILLRRNWARILTGAVFAALAAMLLSEMVASFIRGYKNTAAEWLTAVSMFIVLVMIGRHVLRSERIRRFFGKS